MSLSPFRMALLILVCMLVAAGCGGSDTRSSTQRKSAAESAAKAEKPAAAKADKSAADTAEDSPNAVDASKLPAENPAQAKPQAVDASKLPGREDVPAIFGFKPVSVTGVKAVLKGVGEPVRSVNKQSGFTEIVTISDFHLRVFAKPAALQAHDAKVASRKQEEPRACNVRIVSSRVAADAYKLPQGQLASIQNKLSLMCTLSE